MFLLSTLPNTQVYSHKWLKKCAFVYSLLGLQTTGFAVCKDHLPNLFPLV